MLPECPGPAPTQLDMVHELMELDDDLESKLSKCKKFADRRLWAEGEIFCLHSMWRWLRDQWRRHPDRSTCKGVQQLTDLMIEKRNAN